MASNSLTVIEKFELVQMDDDFLSTIQEEMEGLGRLPIDAIKIPVGGGITFEVPGDDPENPEVAKEIVGVIVAHSPQGAYWEGSYSGGKETPACMSVNGKIGINTRTGETRECADCPFNQFGSAVDEQGRPTRGKACKNTHVLYIMQEGALMPVRMNVPATSIKVWKEYLAKRLLLRGKKPSNVVTKISLKKDKNTDGIVYSQCVFTKVGDLAPGVVKSMEPMVALAKQLINEQPKFDIEPAKAVVDAPFAAQPATTAETVEAEAMFEEVPF